jgi:hypothetical protein
VTHKLHWRDLELKSLEQRERMATVLVVRWGIKQRAAEARAEARVRPGSKDRAPSERGTDPDANAGRNRKTPDRKTPDADALKKGREPVFLGLRQTPTRIVVIIESAERENEEEPRKFFSNGSDPRRRRRRQPPWCASASAF